MTHFTESKGGYVGGSVGFILFRQRGARRTPFTHRHTHNNEHMRSRFALEHLQGNLLKSAINNNNNVGNVKGSSGEASRSDLKSNPLLLV